MAGRKPTLKNENRRNFLRYTSALGIATSLSVALAACGKGPDSSTSVASKSANGGEIDQHLDAEIGYNNNSSWDPVNTAGSAFSMCGAIHIYEPLFDGDPVTRKPFAALAAAIPSDADLKNKDLTIKLRDGATWHDGKPVTADDVVYTFARILNKDKLVIPYGFFATWLNSVEKVDDTTVVLHMKFPFINALERLSVAKIVPKHAYEGKDDNWLKDANNQIGSGPFKITGHQSGSFTKFERFEQYNGPLKPALKSMQWNVAIDASARVAQLTSKQGGMLISDNIPQDNIDSLKKSGLTVEGADSMNQLALVFDTRKAQFADARVRQALHYAIDSKKLIDIAVAGKGKPASCYLNSSNPDYKKAATVYDYNPEKAKELLKAAGIENLTVNLQAVNISWMASAVNTIKECWDAIGVKTTLDVKDTSALVTAMSTKASFDVAAFSGNPTQFGIDGDLNIRWFYSDSSAYMNWTAWNKTPEYKNLMGLLDAALQESDSAAHKEKLGIALDKIAELAVVYPVMHMELFTAWHADKVSGIEALNYPGISFLNAKRIA